MTESDPQPNSGEEAKQQDQRLADLEKLVRAIAKAVQSDREANTAAFERIESAIGDGTVDDALTPVAWIDYAPRRAWDELADWVDWLGETYELRSEWAIRPCWPAHPGVAEELAALWSAWREAARRGLNKDNDALAFWHDRYLAPTLQRLPALYRVNACKAGHQQVKVAPGTDRTYLPSAGVAVTS